MCMLCLLGVAARFGLLVDGKRRVVEAVGVFSGDLPEAQQPLPESNPFFVTYSTPNIIRWSTSVPSHLKQWSTLYSEYSEFTKLSFFMDDATFFHRGTIGY